MRNFQQTTHLSKIIEKSDSEPVIIFIHSSDCNTSSRVYSDLEKALTDKTLTVPVYIVTVQEMPALSAKIEQFFDIKHESPQVLILNKGLVVYTTHHDEIDLNDFIFK